MFSCVKDILPDAVADELLRLARLDREWCEWLPGENNSYGCRCKYHSPLRSFVTSGADFFSMWGYSTWLLDGPKVFRPTAEQCAAMEQIEVRLQLSEYSQPFPALLVDLPSGYEPFESILCFHSNKVLVFTLNSVGHLHDITTTVAMDGRPIETSLQTYDRSIDSEEGAQAARALRVACNACLALSSYGVVYDHLYPKVVQNDRKLAQEKSERGARAKKRLETAPNLVKFAREVVLHRTAIRPTDHGDGSVGCEKASHWRRGHWAMQAYGEGRALRKRILRPPVLVRPDKFLGDLSDTTTTYKG